MLAPRPGMPDAHRERLIRAVGVLAALVGACYLIWRIGWTVNGAALWLALPLLVAEIHGFLTYLGFLFMTCIAVASTR